jgi:hypothetical protein
MKKLFVVAAVAVVALSSCKKNYTCDCTYGSAAVGLTGTYKSGVFKATSSKAKTTCDNLTASTYGGSCKAVKA